MIKLSPKPLPLNTDAPTFGRLDQHSRTVYSEQLIQQGGFLLHFFFAPWAGGSKRSLLALKDLTPTLLEKGITILAANPYDWQIQHALAHELDLPFSLLYDPIAKTAKAYGAVMVNTFFNHELTYLVDKTGQIAYVHKGKINREQLLADILPLLEKPLATI